MGMWSDQTDLRRATAADIPSIMEIERQPGFDQLVGRWSEAEHLHNISHAGYLYLVLDGMEGLPIAFAALSGLGDGKGEVMMNRMIVRRPGEGTGRRMLERILELVFDCAPTDTLFLRVATYNERAIHVYRSLGFEQRTVLPSAGRRPDGVQVDLLLMALERENWGIRKEREAMPHI